MKSFLLYAVQAARRCCTCDAIAPICPALWTFVAWSVRMHLAQPIQGFREHDIPPSNWEVLKEDNTRSRLTLHYHKLSVTCSELKIQGTYKYAS